MIRLSNREPAPGYLAALVLRFRLSMNIPKLTVDSIRTTQLAVPMKRPLGTSAQMVKTAPLLLVDLETEQGITGRTYLYCYLPLIAESIARTVAQCVELIKGEAVEPREIGQ